MKKVIIGSVLAIIAIAVIVGLVFFNPFSELSVNNRSFKKAVSSLSDSTKQVKMEDLTSFDWDTVYNFSSYTSDEEIQSIMGFKSNISLKIESESYSGLVFVKDNKVVCKIYGYTHKLNFRFDFIDYEVYYGKINKTDKPVFNMNIENGTKYFTLNK